MKKTLAFSALFLLSLPVFCQNADSLAAARKVDSIVQASRALIEKRDFDKALEINTAVEKFALEKLGRESASYGSVCFNYGRILYAKGDFPEAEKWYLESKAIRGKVLGKEHPDYAWSLNNLATLYKDMGLYEKAEPLYIEALAIREKVLGKKHPEYAASLNNLAILYKNLGNYEKAEPFFLESISIREQVLGKEHPLYAASLNGLASLYLEMDNYEKAEPRFIESITILEKVIGNEHPQYAAILSNLASLYWETGKFEKAEPLLLESKNIWEKVLGKEHPYYAGSLNNLANLYDDMGKYEKAEPLLLESIKILEKVLGKEHPDYALNLNNLAALYWDMGKYEKIEPLYLESIAIREQVLGKEHPYYAASLFSLAILYQTIKKFDAAESLLSETIELDKLLLTKASRHLSEKELNSYIQYFAQHEVRLYSIAQLQAGECALCYNNALFHKGFLLNAVLQVSKLAQADPASSDKYHLFKSYNRDLAAEYSKPISERDNATIADLEEKANTLEKELARTVAGFGEALRQVSWLEVQAALRPNEAAVEFVRYEFYNPKQTDSVMYAALVLRPGWPAPSWVTLGEEKELQNMFWVKENTFGNNINQLYATRGIEPDSTHRSLESLYPFSWRPLDSLLQGVKTVYFSPSGLLHYVNHSAIPIDSEQVLGDRYRLVQLGSTRQLVFGSSSGSKSPVPEAILFGGIRYDMDSTSILQANAYLSQSETVASRGYLNFQNADATLRGGNWQYLPGTEQEIGELEKMLRQTDASVIKYQGYAATEETFKRIGQATPSPHILHIATHGFFFPDPNDNPPSAIRHPQSDEPVFKISDHPMIRSGLLLAGANHAWQTGTPLRPGMEDGILTAYEISQMNLSNTELAVLSACETGLGLIQGNEGVYGLQRAFKIAGAKYLIMSLWQVPDKQTSLLMTTFYKKWLEEKMEIPDAFRAAQKEMRGQGLDPYHWAGFVLVE